MKDFQLRNDAKLLFRKDPKEDLSNVWEAVFSLPQKYRDVVYLHYFEEYTAPQISRILGKSVNTVYTVLTCSKQMLREKLGGGYDYE